MGYCRQIKGCPALFNWYRDHERHEKATSAPVWKGKSTKEKNDFVENPSDNS